MIERGLELELERLRKRTKSAIIPGHTQPICSIEHELKQYFDGFLKEFKTDLISK
jgi:AraC family transcriptional regulator of adaptative response/methylated-DNA-[protein]-cysteine methyltransferase